MALKMSLVGPLAALALSVFACSSPAPDLGMFDDNGFARDEDGDGSGSPSGGGLGGDPSTPRTDGIGEACATSTASAEQLPLHMVVVLDKSGSMCEYTQGQFPRDCGNASSKWQQVTRALGAFFASPASKGISVSLVAFPRGNACSVSTYQTPLEADVALPDTAGKLAARMSSLSGDGSTPTRPALEGALGYAKGVEANLAGKGKVAVVLATDGLPQECSNNAVGDSANVAASVKATIPTYVIGVGNLLNNLNAIAQAGGTNQAFVVSTANAGTVGQSFSDALAKIRGASLACEYGLPAPPAGQTLDLQRVNVQYTGTGGAATTLPFSADCARADGWRYDDAAAPSKITLCHAACDEAKSDASAKIDLVLGCQTVGGGVK